MADEVKYEDTIPLGSRISWAAILGGSVIALALYMVLTLLFAGIGLSLTDAGVRTGTVAIAAVIAAVITMVVSLFIGGWVTTQLTVGETRQEAVIHGVLTWAAVTGITLFLVANGVGAGYNALMGATFIASNQTGSWEEAARAAGVPQERINQLRQSTDPQAVQQQANTPENQERIRQGAMIATWATLAGTLLSIGSAVWGAMAGCGPRFRLFPVVVRSEGQRVIVPNA